MNTEYTLDLPRVYDACALFVSYQEFEDINQRPLLITAIEKLAKAPLDPDYPLESAFVLVDYMRSRTGNSFEALTIYRRLRIVVEAAILDTGIKKKLIELLNIIGTNLGAIESVEKYY